MNWSGIALLALEYLPTWIDFAKKEEPAVADFIAKAKAALHPGAPVAGTPAVPALPALPIDLGTLLQDIKTQLGQLKPPGFTS